LLIIEKAQSSKAATKKILTTEGTENTEKRAGYLSCSAGNLTSGVIKKELSTTHRQAAVTK
jgi:hypothetical protein